MSILSRARTLTKGVASVATGSLALDGGPVLSDTVSGGRLTIDGVLPHIPKIWNGYDQVGEFHFQANFLAACLSRCTLRVGWYDADNKRGPAFGDDGKVLPGVPSTLAKLGAKMIAGLRSAPTVNGVATGPAGGHGLLLSRMGANLIPAGECYLVATKTPMGDHWEVLSTMEMQPIATPEGEKQRFRRRRFAGAPYEEFTPNFYLRIYLPHPRHSGDADTAARSMLSTLERLALLNDEGVADSRSRLTRGILWLASEIDFPATDEDPDGDQYMTRQMIAAGTAAIRDTAAASRMFPLVARAPREDIKSGILHQRFDYNDAALIEKRAAAVGDLARGAPLPYETTVGMSETSFSNAFSIEGQLANIFVSPVLDLITGFLTGGWFTRGLMLGSKQPLNEPPSEDISRLCVWYDVSDLVTDPDPTKVAMWAYGSDTNPNSIIGAKGVRRLLGIPEGEKPSDEETAERMERSKELRSRGEKGAEDTPSNAPDTTPEDGKPAKDQGDGKRNKDEEVGKRVMALAETMVSLSVDTAGSKLVGKVANRPDLKARIVNVNSADVARTLGAGVIESLGGTGPLFNGSFAAFGRTVTELFSEVGRDDASELAEAAVKMARAAALARLMNPTARIDVKAAAGFLELLNQA